jgi:peptidoglycan/LPS O-acetylase OafA/YrhL
MRFALVIGFVLALAARPLSFDDGGTTGAWTTFFLFWGFLGAYLAVCFAEDVIHRSAERRFMTVRWLVLALSIAVLFAGSCRDDGTWLDYAGGAALLLGLPVVIWLSVRDWRRTRRA